MQPALPLPLAVARAKARHATPLPTLAQVELVQVAPGSLSPAAALAIVSSA
jgi:hypothetical protein